MPVTVSGVALHDPSDVDLIDYPDSDGEPMADNDAQRDLMFLLAAELREHFSGQNVYVSANIFWYPVQGRPSINMAPDVMAVFGRPQYKRRSYRQWVEDGIGPQFVLEVRSLSNSEAEMNVKHMQYQSYGVQEYIVVDQIRRVIEVWGRRGKKLVRRHGWSSELLGLSFEFVDDSDEVQVSWADGSPLRSFGDLAAHARSEASRADAERVRAETERVRAETERVRAEAERVRAEAERVRADEASATAERLAAQLRALGIDPDT